MWERHWWKLKVYSPSIFKRAYIYCNTTYYTYHVLFNINLSNIGNTYYLSTYFCKMLRIEFWKSYTDSIIILYHLYHAQYTSIRGLNR